MQLGGYRFSLRTLVLDFLGACVLAAAFVAGGALVIAMGPAS